MDLSKLSLGDKIIGGTTIVLIIDLLFLPWHKINGISVSVGGTTIQSGADISRTGIQSPNSFWGLLALLLTLAVLALVVVRKLTTVQLPDAPRPWGELTFFATIAVLVLLLLKTIIETRALSYGCYLAILLAAGMVYGGYLERGEADATSTGTGQGPTTPF